MLIDEAHRLAPKEKQTDERMERIKNRLIDAART
ncbi:AAA ATPase, partial [Thermoanaerobacter ethanolicus JW 200]